MSNPFCISTRRTFLKLTAGAAGALSGMASVAELASADDKDINIIGPKPGYTPQVGTLVSMLTWMQTAVDRSTDGLTQQDLDWLFDSQANTIGALMLHLAATETYYQLNTFDGMKWDSWPGEVKNKWDAAMNLGDAGRATIKGHDRAYYLKILAEARETSLAEFRKRDDKWLMAVDKDWGWGLTNNYCKWFHVCEHISHHSGQIALLRKRLPSAKQSKSSE